MDIDAEFGEQPHLHHERPIGGVGVRGVGDVDVVGFVPGHELVAGDAAQDGVHDGPGRRGGLGSPLALVGWQRNC
jgi:hypothetical protein